MKKKMLCFSAFVVLTVSWASGQGVRDAVWAGQFYDKDSRKLAAQIDLFLREAEPPAALPGKLQALIVPHAGYVFSGRTAAYAFGLLRNMFYDTVVILGPSHRYGFDGCSIYAKGGFRTPLGIAAVDESLAEAISEKSGFSFIPEAHQEEHSIEVEIPFIQAVLPEAKIVPIVIGSADMRTVESLASALEAAAAGKKVLVVASTDMSHFLAKSRANAVDARTIAIIKDLDAERIVRKTEAGENILCGGSAVAAAILYAKFSGSARVEILKYADSSEANGDEDRVVGYVSAALLSDQEESGSLFDLTSEEKKDLLGLARTAVEEFILENKAVRCTTQNPRLLASRGAFVTIKKEGLLRGCVGYIEPVMSLCQTVIQTAVYAATEDARFLPVSPEELGRLEYEISVLSPLEEVKDPRLIVVGKHGLVIEQGGQKGLLLPQVATENGWDRETFLEQTCLKAGLPSEAWKKGAKIFRFEALVFH